MIKNGTFYGFSIAHFLLLIVSIILASCMASSSVLSKRKIIKSDKAFQVLKITDKEDSVFLRKKCDQVQLNKENEKFYRHFSERLIATVKDSASLGVGIAAPQVGWSERIIVVQRFDKDGFPFEVYFNPQIIIYGNEKKYGYEGCLSIPDRKEKIQRSMDLKIRYQDIHGVLHEEWVKDFTAVIFQHEIDHLDGILYIDHLENEYKKVEHE